MTRINCIPVRELGYRHLLAEVRELPRITKYLIKSLKKHENDWKALEKEIPKEYTLNKGHVKYHYDKLAYVIDRYTKLLKECRERGYRVRIRTDWVEALSVLFDNGVIPAHWYGYPILTQDALNINRVRIAERNGGAIRGKENK